MSETQESGDAVEATEWETHYVVQMVKGERSTAQEYYTGQVLIVVFGNQYSIYGDGLDIKGVSQATTPEEIFQEAYAKSCDELNERFAKSNSYVSDGMVLSSRKIPFKIATK